MPLVRTDNDTVSERNEMNKIENKSHTGVYID